MREASTEVLAARAVCSGRQGQMWNALAACLAACKLQQLLLQEESRRKNKRKRKSGKTTGLSKEGKPSREEGEERRERIDDRPGGAAYANLH